MKKSLYPRLAVAGILVIAVVLLVGPLIKPGFIRTDDGNWMIIRLSAFYQSLAEGQFPVRFLGRLNYSYGYPVANFLYPGFLYVGSLIHLLGFSFVDTTKILIAGSAIASVFFVYLWLRKFFGVRGSTAGAISFILGPYMFFDLYQRGSVGELFAIPWAIMALYCIESGHTALFAIALALLIVSHNTIALIFLVFYVFYLLGTGRMRVFMPWLLIGIGMATFFWFPALYEQRYVVFSHTFISMPGDYFLGIVSFGLTGFAYVAALWGVLQQKIKHRLQNNFLLTFVLCLILVFPISKFFWNIRIVGNLIQFPFRMLVLAGVAGSWLVGLSIDKAKKFTAIPVLIGIGIFLQIWQGYMLIRYESHPEGYYLTNEATTTVADEYMPRWVSTKPVQRASSRVEFRKGSGSFEPKIISTQYIQGIITATSDSIVQINTLYYPGWGVTLDGVLSVPDYHNPFGVMQIAVSKGTHEMIASFRETVPRFIADLVSFVCVILFSIFAVKFKKRT